MIEILTRAAVFEPSTFNEEKRTIEVVFTTGAAVLRNDWEGSFQEQLSTDPEAVNLSELRGASVLNTHNRFDVREVLAVVEDASMDGTRGVARLRFGERLEIAGIVQDIRGGVIRSVSVGYTVQEWKVEKRADGTRIKTATKWTPKEISFTPLAADAGAKTRSEPMNHAEQIRSIATAIGVSAAFADDLVTRNLSLEDARKAIIGEAARSTVVIDNRAPLVTRDGTDGLVARMADAVYVRINPAHKPANDARPYVGRRLPDLARELLRERGLSTFGSDAEIVTRSLHSTSDFPLLLQDVTGKVLAAAYQVAPSGMKVVCRRGPSHPDFKGRKILRRGELPTLEKVNESGEFKRGSLLEGKESYSVATYGKVFGMTRQTIINDDLSALADIAAGWGLAAMEFENSFLVDKLTENSGGGPTLADAKNLFHADHGNLAGSGGAISDTTLGAARLAMRTQKGLDGSTPINATPRSLLVPAAIETTAEKYLATIYPAQAANVNPFGGTNVLTLVVDPRLDAKSATRWYVFADPAVLPILEYAYLEGFEGVQVETRAGFDMDGVEIKARLDFGAGGIDFRGAYANAGA